MTHVRLSYEEKILNALIRQGGKRKDEKNHDFTERQFVAIRDILQPLYDQVEKLEAELRLDVSRELAVEYAVILREKLRAIKSSEVHYLRRMCDQVIEHAGYVPNEWPVAQLHRLIGQIQGFMIAHNLTTAAQEKKDYEELVEKHK